MNEDIAKAELQKIGGAIGYGRSCQILGELWDDYMESMGLPRGRGSMERKPKIEAIEATMEDPILIPRGLIGAACSAIDKQRPAEKLLAKLREYTFGAKSGFDAPINTPIDIAPDFVNAVYDLGVNL